jgi:hypothetical protein
MLNVMKKCEPEYIDLPFLFTISFGLVHTTGGFDSSLWDRAKVVTSVWSENNCNYKHVVAVVVVVVVVWWIQRKFCKALSLCQKAKA